MIVYKKTGLNATTLRLLKKLEDLFPIHGLLVDIENKFKSVIEVSIDGKTYGILVTRGEYNYKNELVCCLHHVIAEDGLQVSFSSIIAETFEKWLKSLKDSDGKQVWSKVKLETDDSSLYNLAYRFMGKPICYTFEKEIKCTVDC